LPDRRAWLNSSNEHRQQAQDSKESARIMGKNIGFVSTRFAGTDGVSLEASKWAAVLTQQGYRCFWFAGELDRNPDRSLLVPEAHFKHPLIQQLHTQVCGQRSRNASTTDLVHHLRSKIKRELHNFVEHFRLDLLIVENAFAIPMNLPLGLALVEAISETQIPTIAHHHDFYWERSRYSVNAIGEYLQMAFPPNLPNIEHVVINSAAREELAHRRGVAATVIPNVLDFENPPMIDRKKAQEFRSLIGLSSNDIGILQPTRIIRRKGIELAIELIKSLKDPSCKLVLSHESGDEGPVYAQWLQHHAYENGVDLRLARTCLTSPWAGSNGQRPHYCLWHIYPLADFITFPSLKEGFGNALLETIYFKKPMLVNRYATYVQDIEPLGFDLITINGFLTREIVDRVKEVLFSPVLRQNMTERNYEIASKNYSYSLLRKRLTGLVTDLFDRVNPNLAKAGGLQSQGVKGEAAAHCREPLTTQDMASSGFPVG
jgi:glycosyltransferase involved in cell wall biosynthesis